MDMQQPERIVNQKLGKDGNLLFEIQWKNTCLPYTEAYKICGDQLHRMIKKYNDDIESTRKAFLDSSIKNKTSPLKILQQTPTTTPFEEFQKTSLFNSYIQDQTSCVQSTMKSIFTIEQKSKGPILQEIRPFTTQVKNNRKSHCCTSLKQVNTEVFTEVPQTSVVKSAVDIEKALINSSSVTPRNKIKNSSNTTSISKPSHCTPKQNSERKSTTQSPIRDEFSTLNAEIFNVLKTTTLSSPPEVSKTFKLLKNGKAIKSPVKYLSPSPMEQLLLSQPTFVSSKKQSPSSPQNGKLRSISPKQISPHSPEINSPKQIHHTYSQQQNTPLPQNEVRSTKKVLLPKSSRVQSPVRPSLSEIEVKYFSQCARISPKKVPLILQSEVKSPVQIPTSKCQMSVKPVSLICDEVMSPKKSVKYLVKSSSPCAVVKPVSLPQHIVKYPEQQLFSSLNQITTATVTTGTNKLNSLLPDDNNNSLKDNKTTPVSPKSILIKLVKTTLSNEASLNNTVLNETSKSLIPWNALPESLKQAVLNLSPHKSPGTVNSIQTVQLLKELQPKPSLTTTTGVLSPLATVMTHVTLPVQDIHPKNPAQPSTSNNLSRPMTPLSNNLSRPATPLSNDLSGPATPVSNNLSRPATPVSLNVLRPATPLSNNISIPATSLSDNFSRPATPVSNNSSVKTPPTVIKVSPLKTSQSLSETTFSKKCSTNAMLSNQTTSTPTKNITLTPALSKALYCTHCDRLFNHLMQYNYHKRTYCKVNQQHLSQSPSNNSHLTSSPTNDSAIVAKPVCLNLSIDFAVTSPLGNFPILPLPGFEELLDNTYSNSDSSLSTRKKDMIKKEISAERTVKRQKSKESHEHNLSQTTVTTTNNQGDNVKDSLKPIVAKTSDRVKVKDSSHYIVAKTSNRGKVKDATSKQHKHGHENVQLNIITRPRRCLKKSKYYEDFDLSDKTFEESNSKEDDDDDDDGEIVNRDDMNKSNDVITEEILEPEKVSRKTTKENPYGEEEPALKKPKGKRRLTIKFDSKNSKSKKVINKEQVQKKIIHIPHHNKNTRYKKRIDKISPQKISTRGMEEEHSTSRSRRYSPIKKLSNASAKVSLQTNHSGLVIPSSIEILQKQHSVEEQVNEKSEQKQHPPPHSHQTDSQGKDDIEVLALENQSNVGEQMDDNSTKYPPAQISQINSKEEDNKMSASQKQVNESSQQKEYPLSHLVQIISQGKDINKVPVSQQANENPHPPEIIEVASPSYELTPTVHLTGQHQKPVNSKVSDDDIVTAEEITIVPETPLSEQRMDDVQTEAPPNLRKRSNSLNRLLESSIGLVLSTTRREGQSQRSDLLTAKESAKSTVYENDKASESVSYNAKKKKVSRSVSKLYDALSNILPTSTTRRGYDYKGYINECPLYHDQKHPVVKHCEELRKDIEIDNNNNMVDSIRPMGSDQQQQPKHQTPIDSHFSLNQTDLRHKPISIISKYIINNTDNLVQQQCAVPDQIASKTNDKLISEAESGDYSQLARISDSDNYYGDSTTQSFSSLHSGSSCKKQLLNYFSTTTDQSFDGNAVDSFLATVSLITSPVTGNNNKTAYYTPKQTSNNVIDKCVTHVDLQVNALDSFERLKEALASKKLNLVTT